MRHLPNSETLISELCLGTMMFGDQVKEQDAIAQLDAATKLYGINFIVSCTLKSVMNASNFNFMLLYLTIQITIYTISIVR